MLRAHVRHPVARREEEPIPAAGDVVAEVLLDDRQEVRRDRHVTGPGVRLRRPNDELAVRSAKSSGLVPAVMLLP